MFSAKKPLKITLKFLLKNIFYSFAISCMCIMHFDRIHPPSLTLFCPLPVPHVPLLPKFLQIRVLCMYDPPSTTSPDSVPPHASASKRTFENTERPHCTSTLQSWELVHKQKPFFVIVYGRWTFDTLSLHWTKRAQRVYWILSEISCFT